MFRAILSLSLMVKLASAIVCLPDMCEHVTQPLLDCKGGLIKNGGFCGCTDVCAKLEGEACQAEHMFGMIPEGTCDLGLHCVRKEHMRLGLGVCVKPQPDADLGVHHPSERETVSKTLCEQMRLSSMISMVVYEGQWFAKCDSQGNFLPMQCDNTQHCFCVDTLTGAVQDGTKVLGTANC